MPTGILGTALQLRTTQRQEEVMETPAKILQLHPHIEWSPQQIGWLYSLGLVQGSKIHHSVMVNVEDVLKLYKLRKN